MQCRSLGAWLQHLNEDSTPLNIRVPDYPSRFHTIPPQQTTYHSTSANRIPFHLSKPHTIPPERWGTGVHTHTHLYEFHDKVMKAFPSCSDELGVKVIAPDPLAGELEAGLGVLLLDLLMELVELIVPAARGRESPFILCYASQRHFL